jgi:hypothetical protein
MADDKAKIDWKMFETSGAETAPEEAVPALSPAPGPAPAAPAAPASPAGKIVFHCSNGHRIVVPATMGGQRGKCSKCNVAVRIPISGQSAAVPPRAAETQSGEVGAEAAAESPAGEESAPASTAPTRFGGGSSQQIDHEDAQAVGQSEPREDMFSSIVTTSDSQVSATEFVGFSTPAFQADAARPEPGPGGSEQVNNPTAALMARLFQEIEHGGIVEVHIAGGSVILPEFYESRWSEGSHGLFASRAADGSVTLTAVAWDSIQKIIVRQVNGLPDGMFE